MSLVSHILNNKIKGIFAFILQHNNVKYQFIVLAQAIGDYAPPHPEAGINPATTLPDCPFVLQGRGLRPLIAS